MFSCVSIFVSHKPKICFIGLLLTKFIVGVNVSVCSYLAM